MSSKQHGNFVNTLQYFKDSAALQRAQDNGNLASGLAVVGGGLSIIGDDGVASAVGSKSLGALFLGTSITAFLGQPLSGYTASQTSMGQSWAYWMLTVMGQPFKTVINAGVSGNTTTQMVARYSTDVAAKYNQFDILFFEPGPNDMGDDAITFATIQANYISIISAALGAGKFVIVLTPTVKSTQTAIEFVKRQQILSWLDTYIDGLNNIILVNTDQALCDPATGLPASGLQVDGVHPSVAGASAMGRLVASKIQSISPKYSLFGGQRKNCKEYLPNPGLSGGNASGTNSFYLGTGTTGTGPDATALAIAAGTFTTCAIAPKTFTGTEDYNSGGCVLTLAASAANAKARLILGSNYQGAFGTVQNGIFGSATWVATTAYVPGQHIFSTGFPLGVLTCVTGGTSGATMPAPTSATNYGQIITDGTVTWMWQKIPADGDKFVAEIDYEITALTGGVWIDANLIFCRQSVSLGEAWGNLYFPLTDTGVSNAPTVLIPRKGVLRSPILTLVNPGVVMRYAEIELDFVCANGATATIEVKRASILNIS